MRPFAYNAYGFDRATGEGRLGFNGEYRAATINSYVLGQGYRFYNTVLMRFNAPDSYSPFGEGGVNAYAYCMADPVNSVDRDGHMPIRSRTPSPPGLSSRRSPPAARRPQPDALGDGHMPQRSRSPSPHSFPPPSPRGSPPAERRMQPAALGDGHMPHRSRPPNPRSLTAPRPDSSAVVLRQGQLTPVSSSANVRSSLENLLEAARQHRLENQSRLQTPDQTRDNVRGSRSTSR
ncbi:RHS repeat-associated core domain-containing protein [Pseudomonas xanthosomatis]|uniref:RHS repeat-associated core domain-containing protein n=1 Tax=Pseudomonas xanthosomatis TaxID=2842356 RepID=UPI003F5AAC60